MTDMKNHKAFAASMIVAGREIETKEGPNLEEIQGMLGDLRDVAKGLGSLEDLSKKAAKIDEIAESSEKTREDLEKLEADFERKQSRNSSSGFRATREQIEHKAAFEEFLRNPHSKQVAASLEGFEEKAASGSTGGAGGFAVPEMLLPVFSKRAKDGSAMRGLATIFGVASGNIKIASSNNDAASGWVGENDTRAGTSEPTMREAAPTFGMVYALVEASEELTMDAMFPIDNWFSMSAADEIVKAEGAAFIGGNGTNKPTGFLNTTPEAADDATGRTEGALQYIPGGSAGSLADPDVIISLVYEVRAEYRAGGTWLMNSRTAGVVRKLKDSDGRYLWQDGLTAGQPSLLAGYPVAIDENMPDIAADAFPIAFGDFRRGYVICDHGGVRVTVDDNISTPGKVKWYIRRRVGGAVWDDHAIKLIKIATS